MAKLEEKTEDDPKTKKIKDSRGTPSHTPPNTYRNTPFSYMKEQAELDALLLNMLGSIFQYLDLVCSKLSQELLVW